MKNKNLLLNNKKKHLEKKLRMIINFSNRKIIKNAHHKLLSKSQRYKNAIIKKKIKVSLSKKKKK